jgi:hypothetical protein
LLIWATHSCLDQHNPTLALQQLALLGKERLAAGTRIEATNIWERAWVAQARSREEQVGMG